MRLSGGMLTVRLNRILLLRKVVHNLVSVSGLYRYDYTVLLTKTDFMVKTKNTVVLVGKRKNEMYAIELQLNGV